MIKAVLLGVWVCIVTLGASYGALTLLGPEKKVEDKADYFGGMDYVKTEMVGVPIIREGKLQGYIVFEFVYTIEQKLAHAMAIKPDVFLIDYGYRRIYGDETIDYRHLKPSNLTAILKEVREAVNKRYGKEVVHDLLVERLTYLGTDAVRLGKYNPEGAAGAPAQESSKAKAGAHH